MTRTSLRLAAVVSAFALPLSAQTVTTTLLNDDFVDADRTNQSLPDSAKWLTSGTNVATNIDAAGGSLFIKNGLTSLSYFTSSGSPVTLAVGESLTLSFTVSLSAVSDAAGSFRVGLYNSGTRLTNDNFGNTNAAFTGAYAGYTTAVNVGATSNNIFRLYERGASTALIAGSISNFTQTGSSSGGAFKTFVANNVYAGTITLSRTAESTMSITQSYSGLFSGDVSSSTASATISDTSGVNTSFDTLAFYYNNTANLTFDNIKLDYTSLAAAVPEPSAFAAFAGALALSAGVLRRRRRA